MAPPQSILLFHKGGIGDVVFGLPLIRDLKRAFPAARLTVLTHADGKAILDYSPEVDEAIACSADRERWRLADAMGALRGKSFDIAVSTARSARGAYLLWRIGAPLRVGFSGGPEQLLYTHRAPLRPPERAFTRRYQRLGATLGIPTGEPTPTLAVPEEARQEARSRLARRGWDGRSPLIAVHVGGGWPTKRWPQEHIVAFARSARDRGAALLLQGGAEDRRRAGEVLESAPWVLDTTGNPLREALAEAALCTGAVGIDSGLSHATAALGVPTVFLFGPNDPTAVTPAEAHAVLTRDLPCRPCNRRGRHGCPEGHHRCMRDHSAQAALSALEGLIPSPWTRPA